MRIGVMARIFAAAMALGTVFSVPVSAAAPIGTDAESGATIYQMDFWERNAISKTVDAYNESQIPNATLIASYDTLNFYSVPGQELVSRRHETDTTSAEFTVDVYVKPAPVIMVQDSTGFMTDGVTEMTDRVGFTLPAPAMDMRTETGYEYLIDKYGLYDCKYYLYYAVMPANIYPDDGLLHCHMDASDLYNLFQKEASFESEYTAQLKKYIKDGATPDSAVDGVANYIADVISYDYSHHSHAGSAIEDGLGICGDYANVFMALIQLVPFDETGHVSWTSGIRNVIGAKGMQSATHTWNEVTYCGTSRQLDVCWYDGGNGRNTRWLYMGDAEKADVNHIPRY